MSKERKTGEKSQNNSGSKSTCESRLPVRSQLALRECKRELRSLCTQHASRDSWLQKTVLNLLRINVGLKRRVGEIGLD